MLVNNRNIDSYKLLKNFLETIPCGAYIDFGLKGRYINEVLTKWVGKDRARSILSNKASFDELFRRGKGFSTSLNSISIGDIDHKFMIKKVNGYGVYKITKQVFDSFGIDALIYFFEDITEWHFAEINVQSSQEYIERLMKQKDKESKSASNFPTSDTVVANESEIASPLRKLNISTFMDSDDVSDLEDLLSSMFVVVTNISDSMSELSIKELANLLSQFGKILAVYNETYKIAFSIQLVSREIELNIHEFTKKAQLIKSPMYYFYADLETWVHKLFRDGAPSVDFMNDSIVCNSYQIVELFKDGEAIQQESMLF